MLFARFAQSAAALLLLTIGFAAPVHAQNNKPITSGTWYEDRAQITSFITNALLTFAQTPTGKFLNVTNVSCNIVVGSAEIISGLTLNGGTASGMQDLLRPYSVKAAVTPEVSGAFKYYSIVTNQIFYKFGSGRFPSIEVDTQSTGTSTGSAQCTIVGNLTDD
jgi:hypothetical protein